MRECKIFKQCGGCSKLNLPYETQCEQKQEYIQKLFPKEKILPILKMEDPYGYRHKVIATFGKSKKGIVAGIYQKGTHDITDQKECLIDEPELVQIVRTIVRLMTSFKIEPYEEDSQRGYLRHVQLRKSRDTGAVMVTLVVKDFVFKSKKAFVSELTEAHPSIETIVLNENRRHTSIVLGQNEQVIYGNGHIQDTLCKTHFQLSSRSFYQVNPVQTEKLYETAINFANLTEQDTVLDAYCGIGTIGLIASRQCKSVVGVELNRQAIQDAVYNAKLSHRKNITFVNADAGEYMIEAAVSKKTFDVVFMDPPRTGSDEHFLSCLVKLQPKKVVYISCGPDTQKRDVTYLLKHGYRIRKIQPCDMFPFTDHVETVVLLSRMNEAGYSKTVKNQDY